ncbi:hypothetical protein EHS11_16970 [Leptospira ilyithenensis]|uniref:Uncharacterized protein n=2 Tax=Leptospira ilyithenensis TaxID=2484901 RepID=A0A4R9LK20_9LEPT|nr:hypothetical protein EHS11_16970 [Leptospira ilyithenensis]
MSVQNKVYPSFIFILGVLLNCSCGLFEKRFPPKGEFCDVMVRPPVCLYADFEKRHLFWNGTEYKLTLRTRTEYTFPYQDNKAELLVSTQNRLDMKLPESNQPPKFYMRKKEKFAHEPPK